MLVSVVVATMAPQAAAPVDEDAVCVIVMAAAIPRAFAPAEPPARPARDGGQLAQCGGDVHGHITSRTADDAGLRAMMHTAMAANEARDRYKAVIACDGRYRAAMRRLQVAVAAP